MNTPRPDEDALAAQALDADDERALALLRAHLELGPTPSRPTSPSGSSSR